jgi:hypothetical protein
VSLIQMGSVLPETPPPRCPFTGPGLDVAMCPGCSPESASMRGLGIGARVTVWMTCHHLSAEVRGRGHYYPGCHHPGGLPLIASEVARTVAVPRSRGLTTAFVSRQLEAANGPAGVVAASA